MNIKNALQYAGQRLTDANIENPRFEAELLLSAAIKKEREFLISHDEYQLKLIERIKYAFYILRKKQGYSTAVIMGHKSFFGLDFFVDKNVLVPRPETEIMVEEALNIAREIKSGQIIDIGTGSACIIISLAKKIESQDFIFTGSDISTKALKIAHRNSKRYQMDNKIKFYHSNLLRNIPDKNKIFEKNTIILANLPYLTPAQIKNSPSIKKEPKLALLAGYDGLDYYHTLFVQIKKIALASLQRHKCYILIEIDPSQSEKIIQLAKTHLPPHVAKIKKDLARLDRLVIIETD